MIEVIFSKNEITVSGHARAGPVGQDIVCSAVSTLFQTLSESVRKLTKDYISCVIKSGYACLRYKNPSAKSRILIDSFFIGVSGVAESYPEHVTVHIIGRRGTEEPGGSDKATE